MLRALHTAFTGMEAQQMNLNTIANNLANVNTRGFKMEKIEASNVTPMSEMVNLIAVSRAYEAAQRAMTSLDDLISKAIGTLGTTTA
jgi:flagellar basal body rod protein FlgG